jgi:hypothetical protein
MNFGIFDYYFSISPKLFKQKKEFPDNDKKTPKKSMAKNDGLQIT